MSRVVVGYIGVKEVGGRAKYHYNLKAFQGSPDNFPAELLAQGYVPTPVYDRPNEELPKEQRWLCGQVVVWL